MAEVELQNLVKQFGKDVVAVKNLNMTVKNKEFLVLLGPSGCGKTTTLRSISGLEIPTKGKIILDGKDVTRLRASQRDIAFVFQLYALYPHMTTYKNMAFPLKTQKMPKNKIDEEVRKTAKMLQIDHILDRKPKHLAGGDMQRVALGRALVRRPKVFLLDEPIGTLDAAFREEMRTELKKLHVDAGATSIYVTHDQVEAMSMGDRIAVMNQGVLQQIDVPHEIYANPVNLFVANFIGSPGMNFVNCTAAKGDEGTFLVMEPDGAKLEISNKLKQTIVDGGEVDRQLVLGVRPEDVKVSFEKKEGYLETSVFVVETMGSFNIVDLKYGETIVKARVPASVRPELEKRAYINFDMDRVRLFDKETENTIMN
ncbi:MAG: ABC transporter ATP-binding protein [Spirochaetales bacterium]|nr:ABC transporter ATP-binding protein [Spirochaetales bacterium]MCF7937959.1 ABC transporter ATP-binding protein [Spirochaetales bacterium]